MKLKLWCSLLLSIFFTSAIATRVRAQITPDGTTNTTVNSTDNNITIDSGDRAGNNLFHSFEQFDLPNGSEAFFNNQSDIANIFSRITGGNISEIDGLIRANGDANLFLINPAGIVFGEGATLDIGGSFTASTAKSVVFNDNVEFNATDGDNAPLLTVNMPIGLNYGSNPGNIAIDDSILQVDNGKTLAFLGGGVTITEGEIIAPGGNVNLGGVSDETIELNIEQSSETTNISFSFPENFIGSEILLDRGAIVSVAAEDKGSISLNGSTINIVEGSSLQTGIASGQGTTEAQAGNIKIDATETVRIDGIVGDSPSLVLNQVEENATGNAGNIEISADNVEITNGGQLNTSTRGIGKSGIIKINASGTVVFDALQGERSSALSQVGAGAVGDSGGIEINASNLEITNGGYLEANTSGMGNAGTIQINTANTVRIDGQSPSGFLSAVFSQVEAGAVGNSGGIEINASNLEITNGAQLSATTSGRGDAGLIEIIADEKVVFDGEFSSETITSVLSQVEEEAVGNSGGIKINASNLEITNGAQLSATTSGRGDAGLIKITGREKIILDGESTQGNSFSAVFSQVSTGAEGNSQGIELNGGIVTFTNGAFADASTSGEGNAGTVKINANDSIVVNGESSTGDSSYVASIVGGDATGNSGGIEIDTANLSLQNGGRLVTITLGRGNAGAIDIEASNTIIADGITQNGMLPSGTFSTVGKDAIGNAANIKIDTSSLFVTNSAEISAESLGQGNAGNLEIQADSLSLENKAFLSASTSVGRGGNIELQIAENLTLQDNSTISAEALENANGGNITIDADFVIAFDNQNNDIIASAEEGRGGNINITTNAIFGGLEERSLTLDNQTNDLDASSELGVDGTIEINELEVNPTEALEELPTEVIDAASLVEQNLCQQGRGSEFIVTAKGGVAPSPSQARDGDVGGVDLVKPVPFLEAGGAGEAREGGDAREIVEAKGWILNDRGMVELVASKTDIDRNPPQPKVHCHK